MDHHNIYTILSMNSESITPKYQQIVNGIVKGIENDFLPKDYLLPSINDLSFELDISRSTVEVAYKHLKELGIIVSVPGKGFFISSADFKKPLKIFLLFNKLSNHKKIIYDSFAATLGENAAIDFYIYNNDFTHFKELLNSSKDYYSHYVIIPHFLEGGHLAHEVINTIPKEKLLIMSKLLPSVTGDYSAVFENFEYDIFSALESLLDKLSKYDTIKIIFPEYTYHPKEIVTGFTRFAQQFAFDHKIIHDINKEEITPKTAYISLMEDDLVILIEKILNTGLTVGNDVGVISYNETPIKKIILNGITTISTDFAMMGELAARMILDKTTEQVAVPFLVTSRHSL